MPLVAPRNMDVDIVMSKKWLLVTTLLLAGVAIMVLAKGKDSKTGEGKFANTGFGGQGTTMGSS